MTIKDEIEQVNVKFANIMASGDASGLRALYSDEPWFLIAGADAIKGIDAVLATLQAFLDSGISGISLDTAEIDHMGDTAIEIGKYTLYAGEDVADRGKYLVVWKNIDGNWRLHRDMINTSLAAPE